MTRDGITVRVLAWPGNTADQSVVEEVKRDLNGWWGPIEGGFLITSKDHAMRLRIDEVRLL